jgi:hypothetical protein
LVDGPGGARCHGPIEPTTIRSAHNFLYRFRHVQVAHAAGGDWRSLSRAYAIKSPVTRIRRAPGGAAFLAAEGPPAFLLLPSLPP